MSSTLRSVEPAGGWQDVPINRLVVSCPASWSVDRGEDDGLVSIDLRGEEPRRLALSITSVPLDETDLDDGVEELRELSGVRADETTESLDALSTDGPITKLAWTEFDDGQIGRTWGLVFAHDDRLYLVTLLGIEDEFDDQFACDLLGTLRDA